MTNDLFTILCTTCKSRLKVRDQAAIGQILACPKCGGMVMVKPPPNWSDGPEAPSELPTVTESASAARPVRQTAGASAFDAVEELLSDSPPKINSPPTVAPPVPPRPRFAGGPPATSASIPPTAAGNGSTSQSPPQSGRPAAPLPDGR